MKFFFIFFHFFLDILVWYDKMILAERIFQLAKVGSTNELIAGEKVGVFRSLS